MGQTPADTEREITRLRGNLTAALEEIERRARGGVRGIARTEARLASGRAAEDAIQQARDNPTLLGVAGVVAAGAVAYGVYAVVTGIRERNKPRARLQRGVQQVRGELSSVAERFDKSRRQLERGLLPRGVLLKLERSGGGYFRVSDAKLEPPQKNGVGSTVIKKIVWAIVLSVFMAVGSVLARRIAETFWKAMTHDEPPENRRSVEAI
jgi:hypothetical protein